MGAPPKFPMRAPPKPRQEISRCLKYLLFFLNFAFLLVGFAALCLGLYLACLEWRPVTVIPDLFLNPAIVLISVGVLTSAVTASGCMGALRENVCLLKTYALTLFMSYIGMVLVAFILFVLFYSDSTTGVSITTFLHAAILGYHSNPNYRDLLDYLQSQLGCCGGSAGGYRDWASSSQYNCSAANTLPERCGVPYSCCQPKTTKAAAAAALSQQAAPVQCWRGAQRLALSQLSDRIYTRGCLDPLQDAFEGHAVVVGAAIGAIIIPVCLSVMFANILGKQIDRQRFLLDKEARKEERRRRKAKLRIKDSFTRALRRSFSRGRTRELRQHYSVVDETPTESGGSGAYAAGAPEELRPERLEPTPPTRKESTMDRESPYAGLSIEEIGTERLRPKRSREERRLDKRRRDELEEPIVAARRARTRSVGQMRPPPADRPAKERRRRKKSAPTFGADHSSSSTLRQPVLSGSCSSIPQAGERTRPPRKSSEYSVQKRTLEF